MVEKNNRTARKWGYARVSTEDQDLGLQMAALRNAGIKERFIISEKRSGKDMRRPELQNLIKAAREGDTIYVWKLDRLGRSLMGVLDACEKLHERGINIASLTEPIDTTTAMGKAFFAIILVFAELERNMISERTKAGLAKRRAKGATPGRTHTIRTFPKRLAKFAELRDSGQLETMTHQAVVDAMNKADPRKPKIGHVETYRKWRRDGFPDAPDLPDEPLETEE